jgi:arsenate reductase
MSDVTIYHNPRCSKSRQTLALLEENGVNPNVVEYLKEPPSASELQTILASLGDAVSQAVRKKESLYKELGVDTGDLSESALAEFLSANPSLLERPIVTKGKKAAIGRPPENVLVLI